MEVMAAMRRPVDEPFCAIGLGWRSAEPKCDEEARARRAIAETASAGQWFRARPRRRGGWEQGLAASRRGPGRKERSRSRADWNRRVGSFSKQLVTIWRMPAG